MYSVMPRDVADRTWTVAVKTQLLVLGGTWTFESGVVGSIAGAAAVVDSGSASDAAISPLSPGVPHAVNWNTHSQSHAVVFMLNREMSAE